MVLVAYTRCRPMTRGMAGVVGVLRRGHRVLVRGAGDKS